jgi:hypothetical protein
MRSRPRDPWRDWDDIEEEEDEEALAKTPEEVPDAVLASAEGSSEADDEALPLSSGVATPPLQYTQPPIPHIK